jgi:hypothetical protein
LKNDDVALLMALVAAILLFYGKVGAQCAHDDDCKGNRTCIKGECVERTAVSEIPAVQPASCTKDKDCPGNQICQNGVCAEPGASSASDKDTPTEQPCPCRPGTVPIKGKCYSKSQIMSNGELLYWWSTIPWYVTGTCQWVLTGAYVFGGEGPYGAVLMTGILPTALAGMNQIAINKQRYYLMALGARDDFTTNLYWTGWGLKAASVVTLFASAWRPLAYLHFLVVPASIAVSTWTYSAQRNSIREAVNKKMVKPDDVSGIEVTPYFQCAGSTGYAGILVNF